MSQLFNAINGFVEDKMLNLHTSYIGRVVEINANLATVKPLYKIKSMDGDVFAQSVVKNVPIPKHLQNNVKYVPDGNGGMNEVADDFHNVQVGSIVICVCCERDISESRHGIENVPPIGHHRITDSVVIGVL